ncbi:hypothetical protein DFH09DRAFT_1278881 [Mycena vulgaris]|nr:hypothetical protein DFH09DRAFT_1278881 [Mycena vulgaris]
MTGINTRGARKGSGGVHKGGHASADDDLCKRRRRSEGTGTKLRWGREKPAKRSEAQQGRMLRNRVLGRKGASQEERRVLRHGSEVPARARGGRGEPEEVGRPPIDGLRKLIPKHINPEPSGTIQAVGQYEWGNQRRYSVVPKETCAVLSGQDFQTQHHDGNDSQRYPPSNPRLSGSIPVMLVFSRSRPKWADHQQKDTLRAQEHPADRHLERTAFKVAPTCLFQPVPVIAGGQRKLPVRSAQAKQSAQDTLRGRWDLHTTSRPKVKTSEGAVTFAQEAPVAARHTAVPLLESSTADRTDYTGGLAPYAHRGNGGKPTTQHGSGRPQEGDDERGGGTTHTGSTNTAHSASTQDRADRRGKNARAALGHGRSSSLRRLYGPSLMRKVPSSNQSPR